MGETIDDYCYAYNLARAHGAAIWLKRDWLNLQSPYWFHANEPLNRLRQFARTSGHVNVTSVSEDPEDCLAAILSAPCVTVSASHGRLWASAVPVDGIASTGMGPVVLALENDLDRDLPLAATRSTQGDLSFVHRLPPILPETRDAPGSREDEWILDFDVSSHIAPRGKGTPWRLLSSEYNECQERIRSGRGGLSVMSGSFGLVLTGASPSQRVARPHLRLPGFRTWCQSMAEVADLRFVTSDAGHVAEVAERLWTDRKQMAADLDVLRPLFHEFLCKANQRSTERYPKGDGNVIRGDGYLTYAAAARVLGERAGEPFWARDSIDRLCLSGVLRRGLTLICPDCGDPQFSTMPSGLVRTDCARCAASIPLARATWKKPEDEAPWYYDLHAVVRRLVRDAGDIAILASRQLEKVHGALDSTPESDFIDREGKKTEIDLIAGNQDAVIVGECKATPDIPTSERNKKIAGLIKAAQVLRADEIVLAAGDGGAWSEPLLASLFRKIHGAAWPAGRRPAVRSMTSLRTSSPEIKVVQDSGNV